MKRTLDVWWNSHIVGQLTQNEHGELGFVYAPARLADPHTLPLSASLSKRARAFTKRECRPFFAACNRRCRWFSWRTRWLCPRRGNPRRTSSNPRSLGSHHAGISRSCRKTSMALSQSSGTARSCGRA
ncbi:MAG: HipA N-terminal domain-containing protein [Planctomycetota bacterium]